MADSSIEWTDKTWNPVAGCSIVSPGCQNCYAMKMARRLEAMGQEKYRGLTKVVNGNAVWTGDITHDYDDLTIPFGWKKPRRIFVNSMSDLFHSSVVDSFIDRVFAVMALTPHHTYQILTKRPERMAAYTNARQRNANPIRAIIDGDFSGLGDHRGALHMPLPNVWLGTSVENQKAADERINWLHRSDAAVRFLSCEPLLGPLDIRHLFWLLTGTGPRRYINWVIAGGESGPGARPMHPDWVRGLRTQCEAGSIPFFFKQWGEWAPIDKPWVQNDPEPLNERNERWLNLAGGHGFHGQEVWRVRRVGKGLSGRILDGREWNEYPKAN